MLLNIAFRARSHSRLRAGAVRCRHQFVPARRTNESPTRRSRSPSLICLLSEGWGKFRAAPHFFAPHPSRLITPGSCDALQRSSARAPTSIIFFGLEESHLTAFRNYYFV